MSALPDYLVADVRTLADAFTSDLPQQDRDDAIDQALRGLTCSFCEWQGLRLERAATEENRGLLPSELSMLRGHLAPLFWALHGQGGGERADIDMRVARVRKVRHIVYPPSPALNAVSGLVRIAETEAERRRLRSIEYPEHQPPAGAA